MLLSLYLHFPFCKQKCSYCDFVSAPCTREEMHAYCSALCREIRAEAPPFREALVDTVFFGGGTPSLVPPEDMRTVLCTLRECFRFSGNTEFTSEANPATLTPSWLDAMMEGGLNRLSLGMQAAQDELLRSLGRIHCHRDTREAVLQARQAGIANLNLDLMFALPGQSKAQYRSSIREAAALGAEHISAYSLILEEGTPLYKRVQQGEAVLPSEDEAADMYEEGIALLEKAGYERYEISNFAKKGFLCRHNLGYWQGACYLGLGIAASSMLPPSPAQREAGIFHIRRDNCGDMQVYIREAAKGNWAGLRQCTPIYRQEAAFETLMLGLRTKKGVTRQTFTEKFRLSPEEMYPKTTAFLLSGGLARNDEGSLRLTPRGLELQSAIMVRFMEESPIVNKL